MYDALVQPPVGFKPELSRGDVYVRGGNFSRGAVLALDFNMAYASDTIVGSAASVWANATEPDTTAVSSGPLVIIDADAEDGHRVASTMIGHVTARVLASAQFMAVGTRLFAVDGESYLTDDPVGGDRCVARTLEEFSGASVGLCRIEFDGDHGLFTYIDRS